MAKNFLRLQDINKTYSNGYVAIKNFNLSIKKGEFVFIIGKYEQTDFWIEFIWKCEQTDF